VVEELLMRRIAATAAQLLLITVSHPSAAAVLGALCRAMSPAELQQLQVRGTCARSLRESVSSGSGPVGRQTRSSSLPLPCRRGRHEVP
jgi:hypothetical protein